MTISSSSNSTSGPTSENPSNDESGRSQNQTESKSKNPFLQSDPSSLDSSSPSPESCSSVSASSNTPKPAFAYTSIPNQDLNKYPFKTLNRIIDDVRFSTIFKKKWPNMGDFSLLNSKPFSYSSEISQLLSSSEHYRQFELLTLNNFLAYAPASESIDLEDRSQTLVILRGLLTNRSLNEINHVKFTILEHKPPQHVISNIDKHEYHIIPKSVVSPDDLHAMRDDSVPAVNLIDDAFFKSSNGPNNHILRVSIYGAEFEASDLKPLIDQDAIEKRYLQGIERNKDSNLSSEIIPSPIYCFQTLIKVLRGPINLAPDHPIQTISLSSTSIDAKIDIDLLFNKLSFTLSNDDLVPPVVSTNPSLRESYMRKINELIYVGKQLKIANQTNDFDTTYSFSDNCSLIYRAFGELDKHLSLTHANSVNSSQLPFFTNLSACNFFQDELVIRCFENTIKSDPVNQPHYVDSLKNIIQYKSSQQASKLRAYYNHLTARGELIGYSDYQNALKSLGIELASSNVEVDDEFIVAMYHTAYKNDRKNYTYYNRNLRLIAKVRQNDFLDAFIENEIIPMSMALEELSVEEITEDEVVVTAFEFRLDEVLQANNFKITDEVKLLYKALLSVAVHRKSYILMNYIETKYPDLIVQSFKFSYVDACSKLDVQPSTNDFEVISKFQEKLTNSEVFSDYTPDAESNDDIRSLRQALKTIAQTKNSQILLSFLNSGKIDASLLPAENWPSGLDNIGNTCYLNSLLQYYFCIKPLRDAVLDFNELNVDLSKYGDRKIGGRKVEESEIKRSVQFVYHLKHLFKEMIHTEKRCVQPSKELAYLSFLPLSQPVTFKDVKDKLAEKKAAEQQEQNEKAEVIEVFDDQEEQANKLTGNDSIIVSSQSPEPTEPSRSADDFEMIDLAEGSERTATSVNPISIDSEDKDILIDLEEKPAEADTEPQILQISTDQMESTIEMGRQQDVTECIENVTFQIEIALEPIFMEEDFEQYDLVKKLFYGKTKQNITPLNAANSKPRISDERFFSLIINVSDHPKDIYDSLDTYFSEDLVNLEEGLAKKSLTIKNLPEVLQFHVQRVMFDREKLVAYKSLEPIPFSEQIHLDRYLDTDDEEMLRKRSEVFKWKSEMKELHSQKDAILKVDQDTNLSIIDSLIATKKFLEAKVINHETLSIKADTILAIQDQIDGLREQLSSIHEQLKQLEQNASNQFNDYTKVGYSIFAVFIHRGEASYGHYWVYIKDPHKNIYRKYNDEIVTEVPASEVLNFAEGNTATPYYIVYVKDSLMKQYVEPLKRVINKC